MQGLYHNNVMQPLSHLTIWIGGQKSAKFWNGVLNDLKNRGVKEKSLTVLTSIDRFLKILSLFPIILHYFSMDFLDLSRFSMPQSLRRTCTITGCKITAGYSELIALRIRSVFEIIFQIYCVRLILKRFSVFENFLF